jgi:DNA-binding CsgD family transcriptional regulator
VGVKLYDTPDAVAIGGIHRGPEASPYDAVGLARVGSFVESLSHAATLHGRFRDLKARLAHAETMAGTLAAGLFVVEGDGHVLTMNAAAEAILRRGDGLRAANGRIRAADPATQPLLAAAIAAAGAVAAGRPGPDARGVLVPRTAGGEAYRVAIWPLTPAASVGAGDGGPRVLLSVVDPGRAARPPVSAFAAMYRLTAAEASLVEHLAAGEPLAEIAERRRVRISTLRTQLSTVLAKTGTHRQGDVVRLLSEWPALRQEQPR